MKRLAAILAVMAGLAGPAIAANIDFEDLAPGTNFAGITSFSTGGVTVNTGSFTFSGGGGTIANFARVTSGGFAGGTGNDLEVNNILLDFAFGPIASLSLNFGEFGGNLNLTVNGIFQNFENFSTLNGTTIGGTVGVAVTNGFGNDRGTLTLTGPINSFAIGGQELYIDDIRTTAVPLPASLLLLMGGVLGLGALRRQQTR